MAQDGLLIDAIDLLETCVPTVPLKKKKKKIELPPLGCMPPPSSLHTFLP